MVTRRTHRRAAIVRLTATAVLVSGSGTFLLGGASDAVSEPPLNATPAAVCSPGSKPETGIQGRVPAEEYANGRAAQGYTCNAKQLGHQGFAGGYKTFRYVDSKGHVCAFYDSTLLLGKDLLTPNLLQSLGDGLGVKVLDLTRPARPVRTANLVTPAMLNPHESLVLNPARGLLAASLASPATAPGLVDIYDVRTDCRHPRLLSTSVTALLGHESGFAPDGRTLYMTGSSGTFVAIDVTDPRKPRTIFSQLGVMYHGLRPSSDGRTLYVANLGNPGGEAGAGLGGGLRILDVSQIQDRVPNPRVSIVKDLTWKGGSIPQHADPIVIKGHRYLLEMDEFADFGAGLLAGLGFDENAEVGGARLINIDNLQAPFVVSNLRLAVNNPDGRKASQHDPGARLPVQGYTGHYCSAPKVRNPKLVACSFIASGLRIFNIEDPNNPREVAYFNRPSLETAPNRAAGWAMSAPAWDLKHRIVMYTDANSGFYAVRLAKSVVPKSYWKKKRR